jgi:hypothetical protein
MPFEDGDPLSNIGLEEPQSPAPSGSAWDGLDEFPSASDERAQRAEREIGGGWESDANPYKAKYNEVAKKIAERSPSVGKKLEDTTNTYRQWAAEAWDYATRQAGIPPQLATTMIGTKLEEMTTRAELEATREAALPHVRRGTADEIAREFSDKKAGVMVNADELLDEDTMAGMRAKAKGLAKERRDKMVTDRRDNGVDRAEGAPPSSAKRSLPDSTSPAQRIAYGFSRGHL